MTQSLCIHTSLEPIEFRNFLSKFRSAWPQCDEAIHFDELDCQLRSDAGVLKEAYRLNFDPKSCIYIDMQKPYKYEIVSNFCMFLYFYIGRQNCSIMNPEGTNYNFFSKTEGLTQRPDFSSIVSTFFDDIAQIQNSSYTPPSS